MAQLVKENTNVYARKFQALLDRSTPHVMERWLFTGGMFVLFALSVIFRRGVGLFADSESRLLRGVSGISCVMPWRYTSSTSSSRSYNHALIRP